MSEQAKKRGRPANPNITKTLILDAATKKPIGRGRPKLGQKVIAVTVQKSVKDFDWNTTKYSDAKETVIGGEKPKSTVNVLVIPPVAETV